MNTHELDGRIALVTGAARGIGRDIVRALAECGARVVAADVDAPALAGAVQALRASDLDTRGANLDVTSPENWEAVLADIESDEGRLDILVNNAGIMISRPLMEMTLEDYRRTQTINAESVFIGARAAFPLMQQTTKAYGSHGSVINLSSIFGQLGADMNAAYCASKGAVRALTKALAVEFGRAGSNIRVNSVHPGGVDTDLGRGGLQALIEHGALPDLNAAAAMLQMSTPLGRMAQVDDISGVVAFLASDASRFMTGTEITVDGGFSIV